MFKLMEKSADLLTLSNWRGCPSTRGSAFAFVNGAEWTRPHRRHASHAADWKTIQNSKTLPLLCKHLPRAGLKLQQRAPQRSHSIRLTCSDLIFARATASSVDTARLSTPTIVPARQSSDFSWDVSTDSSPNLPAPSSHLDGTSTIVSTSPRQARCTRRDVTFLPNWMS